MHVLDRPVWSALTTRQAAFAFGSSLALRYDPTVSPFAACRDNSAAALAALAELAPQEGAIALLQADPAPTPDDCEAVFAAQGVQMVADRLSPAPSRHDVLELDEVDAVEMVALAALTKPGPFLPGTHRLGRFVGVRIEGRLAAMAGERFRVTGFTEVSGVCTHPDFRGRGLAAELSSLVAIGIRDRGETPFLHAFADNLAAIRLYEGLGFVQRAAMNVLGLRRKR
jgi:ribosomal protein S18 acetylase RimI-like enzyme